MHILCWLPIISFFLFFISVLLASPAKADPLQLHAVAAAAHAVRKPQRSEFGWGGTIAAHLAFPFAFPFAKKGLAFQLGIQGSALSPGDPNPRFVVRKAGTLLNLTAGLHFQPFTPAGPWLTLNAGAGLTGNLFRPTFESSLGYDVRVGHGRWDIGPSLGYLLIRQDRKELRPEDAHLIFGGIHLGLGQPPPPPSDRDHDGIPDDLDACPDVPGIPTNDPKTNGCPPPPPPQNPNPVKQQQLFPPPSTIHVEGDHIVLEDTILFAFNEARVRQRSWPTVKKLAEFFNLNPDILEVDINGHADQIGGHAPNFLISQARAESVKRLLIKFGVDPKRLTTLGIGKLRLKEKGQSEKERQLNRRVEFIITQVRRAPPPFPGSPKQ